jgi:hypothetical protein
MTRVRPSILPLLVPLLGCPSDSNSNSTGGTESAGGDSTTAPSSETFDPTELTGPTEPGTETSVSPESSSSDGSTTAVVETTESSTTAADESTGGSDSTGTTGEAGIADIDMTVVLEDTQASVRTEMRNFAEDSCAYVDGCLAGFGMRRLLRFSTITPNLGDADFFVGNHNDNPELFVQSSCSGAWLFDNYARYRLLDADGVEVGAGHKSAFALIDLAPFTEDAGPAQYGFGQDMGISVGWADIYDAGLDCQWVDITDVPAGDYTLELAINPDQVVDEATFDNNVLLVPVTIDAEDPLPPELPAEWICNPNYYGLADGCDCGCGAADPDCADATIDACQYCDGCSAGDCGLIDPENNAVCLPA